MTRRISAAPVRKQIAVAVAPDRAFSVFTDGMVRWWPKSHSINASPIAAIVVEPKPGGRWFERGEDGSECNWGKVQVWSPPGRLVLAWQIDRNWRYDPGLVTEVEVSFRPEGAGTRVELEHRLDGYGGEAAAMFEVFSADNAWSGMLLAFAQAAK